MYCLSYGFSFRRIIRNYIQRKRDKAYRQRWAEILKASGTIK